MLGLLVLIEVDPPKKDQEKNGKDGQKAVKQDKEGVVPVGDRAVRIETSARGSQSSEILQILHAEAENKVQKPGFTGQHGDAPDELSPEDLPEAHNDIGNTGPEISSCEGGPDILQIRADPFEKSRDLHADRIFLFH